MFQEKIYKKPSKIQERNFTLPRVPKTNFDSKHDGLYEKFLEKQLYTILLSVEMQIREFVHENFAERVVFLINCPKWRKVIKGR